MSMVVIKSGNAIDPSVIFDNYKKRVLADGGSIADEASLLTAFQFCRDNDIKAASGFSVTNPAWGVKVVGNYISKMYSLFGSAGDVIASGGNITYDTTTYTKPTISLPATAALHLDTAGTFSSLTVGLAQAWLPLAGTSFTASNTMLSVSEETTFAQLMKIFLGPGGATGVYSANGYGITGSIATTRVRSNWAAVASRISPTEMSFYSDGVKIGSDTTLTVPSIGVYRGHLGRAILETTGASTLPLQGNIAESWILISPTESQMMAITNRIKTLY